jgi:N-acetylglucosaminyldiphosphoundecaprenol N-acetyl-beta-D-mannosaminyltransferase
MEPTNLSSIPEVKKIKSYKLLGIEIHPMTLDELNKVVSSSIKLNSTTVIVSQNLHSVYMYHKKEVMQNLHHMSIKRIDGMPLIIIGILYGYPLKGKHRVTWVDWIRPLMKLSSSNNWKIYYLGGKPGVASNGFHMLKSEFPNLEYKVHDGYFNIEKEGLENLNVLNEINEYKADILMVGMGMPRQEIWIYENLDELKTKVIVTCGAAIEYVAGEVRTPPRWMGKIGLEWLFRLFENPKRFWKRYILEPWFIIFLIFKDIFTISVKKKAL